MPLFLVKFVQWWRGTAWPWTKKNWKWLLFPVGLCLLFLQIASRKRVLVVDADEQSEDAEDFRRDAEEDARLQVEAAEAVKDRDARVILEEHKTTVEQLTEEQRMQAQELTQSPEKLNDFLLSVGKDIRK